MEWIKYHEAEKVFDLRTENSTYQMQVREYDTLVHLYYGCPVGDSLITDRIVCVDRGFSGNPYEAGKDKTFSLDTLPQEYSSFGSGDYRESALDIRYDNGTRTLGLRYEGYEIIKAVMLENGRGFALGHHPTAPSPYVTWACYDDKDGQRQYEWGHYGNDRTAMEQDFTDRVQDYQRIYNVGIRQTEAPGLYKYYSTQRPVDIGTFPKPPYNKPDEIFNYDQRIPVENGSFLAWGYLTYTRPLTEKQASDYELRPAPDNPDRPRPIAEQMKNAAKLAEADRGSEAPAPQRRQPDRGDR